MIYGLINLLISSSMEININNNIIKFNLLKSFNQIKDELRNDKSFFVTVEMEIIGDELSSSNDDLANDICLLCSLAMGCTVNWIYKKNKEIIDRNMNAITSNYYSLALIPTIEKNDVIDFLIETFDEYKKQGYKFSYIIKALNNAKNESDFLEIRSVAAAVAIEMLKDYYIKTVDMKKIENSSRFDKVASRISIALLEYYNNDNDNPKYLLYKQNIPSLNNYPFRFLINSMLDCFGMELDECCISNIIRIRNSLIHTGEFLEEMDKKEQYFLLISKIGMMILGILKYKGNYIDWTKLESNGSFEQKLLSKIKYK